MPLLRTAFGLTVLFGVAHTIGTLSTTVRDAQEQAVFDAMRQYRFDAMGVMRTPFDFYYGLGLYLSLFLAVMAALLWMLGSEARHSPARVRPYVGLLALSSAAGALLCWWKFFPAPLALSLLTALCCGLAWRQLAAESSADARHSEVR